MRLPVRSANGLLDGLLRGKVWVACVGVLLVGIVFLNVSLLGLNSGIAVTADRAAELRRENADLRLEVAKLGSSERIQEVAKSRGFVMPAPGDVTYLDVDPEADGRSAALALRKGASGTLPEAVLDPGAPPVDAAVPPVAEVPAETPGEAPATGVPGAEAAPVEPPATAAPAGGAPVAGSPPEPPAG